jgi:hypothetical protein
MSSRLHRSGNVSPEFALLGFLVAGPDHGCDLRDLSMSLAMSGT